jgi:hypothetical protein
MKIVFWEKNHKEPVVFLMKIVFWEKPQRTCCFSMKSLFWAKPHKCIIFSPLPNNFGWYTILFFQALVPQKVSFKRIYAQKDYF